MSTKFNKAPLPFLGQKRQFLKFIRSIDFSGLTVVDLFGGSGLLAHTIKAQHPSARVIYNDFDGYDARLKQIPATEKLRITLKTMIGALPKDTRPTAELKAAMIASIQASGVTDWITISSWLLFSGNYAHSFESLIKRGWYLRVPLHPIDASGYLKGVERTSADFRVLLKAFAGQKDVIFIADPPYIMTNQSGYFKKDGTLFKLSDSIHLIKSLQQEKAIYFSSPKSESDALFDVFVPGHLEKVVFESAIGGGNRSVEYLFLVNFGADQYQQDSYR